MQRSQIALSQQLGAGRCFPLGAPLPEPVTPADVGGELGGWLLETVSFPAAMHPPRKAQDG